MKKMWGSRFKKEMDSTLKCFSYSLSVDAELLDAELLVDEAWAKMLGRTGLITSAEAKRLVSGLHSVGRALRPKNPHDKIADRFLKNNEDVHTLIQTELEKKVGPVAGKLHTGRSRNDLVVTSTKVYLRGKIQRIEKKIANFQRVLVRASEKAGNAVVSGLTHLKKAQPVLLAHHLLAYVDMLEDDKSRLQDSLKRMDVLPLGSAALGGSSLPIDQKFLARQLGFSRIASNSMAAVSDRAFLAEFLSALSILWMHLSRLADDFILWNSEFFGYVELDDAFATGSSLMPQKKNPDVFELVRGRAGTIFGHLQSLLVLQKGLPLTYNRDLQQDKPAVFDAVHKTSLALEVLALTVDSSSFNKLAMEQSAADDNLYATDILEYLVRKKMPFSEAHATVGKIVRYASEQERPVRDLSMKEWKNFSKLFDSNVYPLFEAQTSVRAKKTVGSTHPVFVRREIQRWKKSLGKG